MLLQITHLGTQDGARYYHVQTHTGLQGIVSLYSFRDRDLTVKLALVGTYYSREYPVLSPTGTEPPRIRDLEGGYQTVSSFLQTWEHSSEEQRDELCNWDNASIKYWRTDRDTFEDVRTKTKVRQTEDRPREVPASLGDGTWYRVHVRELRAALKGTTGAQAIRILGITVKRSILWGTKARPGLLDTSQHSRGMLTVDPVVELRKVNDAAIEIRSADGRAKVTVKHGAGDKHQGRHGWDRRIVLQPA